MKIKFLLLTFLSFGTAFSQQYDYSKIDAHARSIKYSGSKTIASLAQSLAAPCANEQEKVRAIFVWITDNIKYDIKTFENRKDLPDEKRVALQDPIRVLRDKKAVCEGYSNLMISMCNALNIKALQVTGVTRNANGKVSRSGHAWCIVRADGNWQLVDPTWGAGDVDIDEGKYYEKFKEQYFFTPPATLILNHLPDDPLLQMLPTPITREEFGRPGPELQATVNARLQQKPKSGYEQIRDSLDAFSSLDSIEVLRSMGMRQLAMEPDGNQGIFRLGLYQYRSAHRFLNAFEASMAAAQGSGKPLTKAVCTENIARLEAAEKRLQKSLEMFGKSVRTDNYSSDIRYFRNAADTTLKTVVKNLETMKRMLSKIK